MLKVAEARPDPATTGVATGIDEPETTTGMVLGVAGLLTGVLPGLPATEMVVAMAVGTGAMAAAGVGAGVLPV